MRLTSALVRTSPEPRQITWAPEATCACKVPGLQIRPLARPNDT